MAIYGIIFCAHQMEQYVGPSLAPWIRARNMRLNGHEYIIAAVSVPFKGFPQDDKPDSTLDKLETYYSNGEIDHLITSSVPMSETDARGAALSYLIDQGAEILWQVDSDELLSLDDINAITRFIEANAFTAWFRVSYRNTFQTPDQYLAEPFCPPRIHRVWTSNGFKASYFSGDNDIAYLGVSGPGIGRIIGQQDLASLVIPQTIAVPKHLTWLNDSRSRAKCAYQLSRWNSCSYRWDDKLGLCFNELYFKKHNLPLPTVIKE